MPPKPPSGPHLNVGSKVEISPDEEGFRGSFFSGTVIRCASKDPLKLVVEYDNLTADEAGKKSLRETLKAVLLRPIPPREAEREFKFSEEVDAYHSEGWWEGVITEELGGGRFAVFFRATREQIEFDQKDLRLHREWMDGEWVPPLEGGGEEEEDKEVKKEEGSVSAEVKSDKAVAVKFSPGTLVEVSSDEDGFEGAWFTAIVVKALEGNKFLVDHKNIKTEDNTGFLREEVDNLHIRLHPPETKVDKFRLLDEVDAWYNDAWWIGVVSKVLPDSRYKVYFKNTNEEIEFDHPELRPHQEWIGGKWVTTAEALKF